jgi:hypothetical protein
MTPGLAKAIGAINNTLFETTIKLWRAKAKCSARRYAAV